MNQLVKYLSMFLTTLLLIGCVPIDPDVSFLGLHLAPLTPIPAIGDFLGSDHWCACLEENDLLSLYVTEEDDKTYLYTLEWKQIDEDTLSIEYVGKLNLTNYYGVWLLEQDQEAYPLEECSPPIF